MSPQLQRAADRSLSEQRALLAAHAKTKAELRKWGKCVDQCVPVLKTAVGRINEQLKKSVADVDVSASKLGDTFETLIACEQARIDLSGSQVCPLDALARGFLGPEVAMFVDTLRMNAKDMQTMCASLRDLKKQLIRTITIDFVGALTACVQRFSDLQIGACAGNSA
jgi:hypothetical protein